MADCGQKRILTTLVFVEPKDVDSATLLAIDKVRFVADCYNITGWDCDNMVIILFLP